MGLKLVGLEPGLARRYTWIGDDQVDIAKSDVPRWIAEGVGLVPVEGGHPTVLVCEPLRPTTKELVDQTVTLGAGPAVASATPVDVHELIRRNWPAYRRAHVAYAVSAIEDGPTCARVFDAGGLRLTDALLDILARQPSVTIGSRTLRLMDHLGDLLIADNEVGASEGKG